jgi:hypothetical protein
MGVRGTYFSGQSKVGGIGLKYRKILIPMTAGLILNSFYSFPQAAPKTQFSIIYTNDVMGEVEPCG